MRESRTYGSGRGACHEMHVPTATSGASSSRCSAARRRRGRSRRARSSSAMRRIGVLHEPRRGRSGRTAPHRSVPAGAAANWAGPSGRNVRIDYRWARRRCRPHSQTRGANWSRSRRTSSWPPAARSWRRCSRRPRPMPIVFATVADPVERRLRREPGAARAATPPALATFEYGMSGKWLELLKEIAPRVTRVAVLRDPANPCRDRPVRRDPGGGAVARGGADARSTCATPARSSAPSRHSRASRMAA